MAGEQQCFLLCCCAALWLIFAALVQLYACPYVWGLRLIKNISSEIKRSNDISSVISCLRDDIQEHQVKVLFIVMGLFK